eukprot:gb/GECG01003994.1/.p1 GENE.gb/GECG01003994.1/~~gb/GECG01003994.1/.p1  ORF type:complete len:105 (+),score=2.95 gb/GECG01003994.1/:1-315(+)
MTQACVRWMLTRITRGARISLQGNRASDVIPNLSGTTETPLRRMDVANRRSQEPLAADMKKYALARDIAVGCMTARASKQRVILSANGKKGLQRQPVSLHVCIP